MQPQSTKPAKQSILPSAPMSDNDLQKPQMAAWRYPQLTFEETAKEKINIWEGAEVWAQTNVRLYFSYAFVLLQLLGKITTMLWIWVFMVIVAYGQACVSHEGLKANRKTKQKEGKKGKRWESLQSPRGMAFMFSKCKAQGKLLHHRAAPDHCTKTVAWPTCNHVDFTLLEPIHRRCNWVKSLPDPQPFWVWFHRFQVHGTSGADNESRDLL